MSAKSKLDSATKPLAERRAELEAILAELEVGDVPVEQVADKLKAAAELAEAIERELRDHRASIEVLKQRFDSES